MSEIANKEVIKMQLALSRMEYYKDVISKTIVAIQRYKLLDVLSHNDYNLGISNLENNNQLLQNLENMLETEDTLTDAHINILQEINDNLSIVCKNYGTESIEDILCICFGTSFIKNWFPNINQTKYAILNKYFHPIGYKLISCTKTRQVKPIEKNKIIEKVNNISDVTLHQNEIFNICKDLITNNREKIIPYIYYNGTNNKNSNSSIIW